MVDSEGLREGERAAGGAPALAAGSSAPPGCLKPDLCWLEEKNMLHYTILKILAEHVMRVTAHTDVSSDIKADYTAVVFLLLSVYHGPFCSLTFMFNVHIDRGIYRCIMMF